MMMVAAQALKGQSLHCHAVVIHLERSKQLVSRRLSVTGKAIEGIIKVHASKSIATDGFVSAVCTSSQPHKPRTPQSD